MLCSPIINFNNNALKYNRKIADNRVQREQNQVVNYKNFNHLSPLNKDVVTFKSNSKTTSLTDFLVKSKNRMDGETYNGK